MKATKDCGTCCKQGGDCCDKCGHDKCGPCCDKKAPKNHRLPLAETQLAYALRSASALRSADQQINKQKRNRVMEAPL